MDDRERKIQEAIEKGQSKWDEKYSQEDWKPKATKKAKVKLRRVGGRHAAKALKNVW